MMKQLRKIERNIVLIILDSGDSLYIRKTQLLGRIISAIWGEWKNCIDDESFYKDEIERQNSFAISTNNKKILVITIYRMSNSTRKYTPNKLNSIVKELK